MSSKEQNKQQERNLIKAFREAFCGFPAGTILADDAQERPDAILDTGSKRIGIEITRIMDPKLRRTESECQSFVDEARRWYESLNLPHLHVSVHLGADKPFTRANREKFGKTLAKLVAKNVPATNGLIEVENDWNDPEEFPYEIQSVLILRNPALRRNHWNAPSAGFFQEDFSDALQIALDKKDDVIGGYDAKCSEKWLLIAADGHGPSAFFDPSPATLSHTYTSSFDRVFFLDVFRRKVSELSLQ